MTNKYLKQRWDKVAPIIEDILGQICMQVEQERSVRNGLCRVELSPTSLNEFFMTAGRHLFSGCYQKDGKITLEINARNTRDMIDLFKEMNCDF
ncbi:MAG: hypothetical protein H6868_02345 [Rhodospirillales bacterium]|nr:hypothetical protein [Rhodospirillales bacterium]